VEVGLGFYCNLKLDFSDPIKRTDFSNIIRKG
jgi:hypothetical protein